MGFRDNARKPFRSGGGGRSFGGNRGGNRDRFSSFGRKRSFNDRDSGTREMFDATCSNCGKQCKVPFKPTGSKPVLCSDCFSKNSGNNFNNNQSPRAESNISSEQFKQINTKLDKIIEMLESLEVEVIDDEDEFESESEYEDEVKSKDSDEEEEKDD